MKAVIVGGGASGICAALMLARYGCGVVLMEHGPRVAPLLRGFRREGLQFDTGFHQAGALDKKGVLRRYLKFIGVLDSLTLTPFRDDCCSLFRFVSGGAPDVCFPQGVKRTGRMLAGMWPEHSKTVRKFFSDVEDAYFHSPFIDPRRMTAESLRMVGGGSMESYMRGLELPARLESLMTARSVYYGTPPERAVFEELALVTYSMLEGVHGVSGGGRALANAFEDALARAGVEVRTGVTVTGIRGGPLKSEKSGKSGESGAVKSVLTSDGEEVPCDACVYTGHPRALPDMLPQGALRPSMARHLRSLEETHSYFMLFGSSRSGFLAGRDMLLCLSDDINKAYRDFSFKDSWLHLYSGTPDEKGVYPVGISAGVEAWPGASAGHGYGRRPQGYADWKDGVAAKALDLVRRHIPELDDFRLMECSSEFSIRDWVHGSTGSLYGKLHGADGFPVMPFTRLDGLLLAGQCVILPGLLGAFISAAVACGSLVGYEKLFRDLACTNAE